jgi:hypothetical protein
MTVQHDHSRCPRACDCRRLMPSQLSRGNLSKQDSGIPGHSSAIPLPPPRPLAGVTVTPRTATGTSGATSGSDPARG